MISRSVSQWLILLLIWGVGLIVWTAYIILFLAIFFRYIV